MLRRCRLSPSASPGSAGVVMSLATHGEQYLALKTRATTRVATGATAREGGESHACADITSKPWHVCHGEKKEDVVEFLVEFELEVPQGTSESEVEQRTRAESTAVARLAGEGHVLRIWRRAAVAGDTSAIGLYRADSASELDGLLRALPLAEWLQVTITPLASHPNDPNPVAP
jgi:muconolactone delta-isomerase